MVAGAGSLIMAEMSLTRGDSSLRPTDSDVPPASEATISSTDVAVFSLDRRSRFLDSYRSSLSAMFSLYFFIRLLSWDSLYSASLISSGDGTRGTSTPSRTRRR